jgi:hypothetical protein
MIMNVFLASLSALVVVAYWIVCRKRAYKYQQEAALLLEQYFADGQVSDKDKTSLYNDYKLSRKCYMLPFMALMTPFILGYMLLDKGRLDLDKTPRDNQKLYSRACDVHLKMMISKNPLISVLCLSFIGICFVVALTFAILLNKISSLPTFEGLVELFSRVGAKAASKAHIH